jgi:heme a synthase
MSNTAPSRWLNRFVWLTAFATLLLICSGGMVTSKGVGLAVPDWPTTFGYNMFLFPFSRWVGGIFFEHTHRLMASTVGMLTLVLAVWLWIRETTGASRWLGLILMTLAVGVLGIRTQPVDIAVGFAAGAFILLGICQLRKSDGALRWFGVIALSAVLLQGVLGGLRVTMLKDEIGIFHALLAQAFLALIVYLALVTTQTWRELKPVRKQRMRASSFTKVILVTTALIYLQLGLGATMRHQHRDLSITDFPTAYGSWWPDTSAERISEINAARDQVALSDVTASQIWLQMAHRIGAILVAVGIATAAIRVGSDFPGQALLRRLTFLWLGLLVCQLTLGAWTIWSNKAADIATAHVAVGATMLSLGVAVHAVGSRVVRLSGSTARMNPIQAKAVAVA